MSIAINKALCKGCTACAKVCPGSLIKMDDDKKPISSTRKTAGDAHPVSKSAGLARSLFTWEQILEVWEAR